MPLAIDYIGKLVLITGGGRGIGLGITKAFAKGEVPLNPHRHPRALLPFPTYRLHRPYTDSTAGANVAITYTSKDSSSLAADLSKEYGVSIRAFKCDVIKSGEVDAMISAVEASWGKKVDMAVANAGISLWKQAIDTTDAEIENMFAVNTLGPFYLSRSLARSWLDLPLGLGGESPAVDEIRGKKLDKQILFVSSISGLVAMSPQRQAAYNASKGGLTMMAKSLAQEWAHLGIYVNAISPGYVATDMLGNATNEKEAAFPKEWEYRTPVGRFATPDETGEFIAVLMSRYQGGGGFMSGSDVVYDGGYTTL